MPSSKWASPLTGKQICCFYCPWHRPPPLLCHWKLCFSRGCPLKLPEQAIWKSCSCPPSFLWAQAAQLGCSRPGVGAAGLGLLQGLAVNVSLLSFYVKPGSQMSWRQCSEVQAPLGTDPNLTVTRDFEESHVYVELLLPYGPCMLSLQSDAVDNFLLFPPNRPELNTVLIIQTEIFPVYKNSCEPNTNTSIIFMVLKSITSTTCTYSRTHKNILNLCSAISDRSFCNDGKALHLLFHYSSH